MTKLLWIVGGALFAVQAHAQVRSVVSSNATPARIPIVDQDGDPDEVICLRVPPPLGSRLGPQRQCATRAQWRDIQINRAFARRAIEVAQTQRPCGQSGC